MAQLPTNAKKVDGDQTVLSNMTLSKVEVGKKILILSMGDGLFYHQT